MDIERVCEDGGQAMTIKIDRQSARDAIDEAVLWTDQSDFQLDGCEWKFLLHEDGCVVFTSRMTHHNDEVNRVYIFDLLRWYHRPTIEAWVGHEEELCQLFVAWDRALPIPRGVE